jgi:hypothetical protein
MSKRDKDLDRIDATVFSSDALFDNDYRAELKHFCKRWLKAIVEHEQPNEITNAPTIEADSGEAVAIKEYDEDGKPLTHNDVINKILPCGTKLFTSPQKQWVGLTTRQIKHIEEKSYVLQTGVNDYEFDFIHFAKAIEAKLKELNHA